MSEEASGSNSQSCQDLVMDTLEGNVDRFWKDAIDKSSKPEEFPDFVKGLKTHPNKTLKAMAEEDEWAPDKAKIDESIDLYAPKPPIKSLTYLPKPDHGQFDGFDRQDNPDGCFYLYPPTCC